jgi:hypothetical protein
MNGWTEQSLEVEDLRRRCVAHGRWMARDPEAVRLAEQIADDAAELLAERPPG